MSEEAARSPPPVLKECVSIITSADATSLSSTRKTGELALSMLVRDNSPLFFFFSSCCLLQSFSFFVLFHFLCYSPSPQGLCYHIARDQEKLFKLKSENKMKDLQSSEIPAMREILSNPALFQAFVSMLNPHTAMQGGTNPQQQITIGRKRAPSEDLTLSRKRQLLSPVPNRQMYHSSEEKTQLPVESTSVLAATCLYSVLQHVDHWPIQIIKAFGEDSFGPRIWVDDERCSAIVANLEQSIKARHNDTWNDATVSAAEQAEKYFSSLGTSSTNTSAPFSISSVPTAPVQTKQPSSKEKRKLTAGSKMDVDTSSSSGEEEVLESEMLPSFSMPSVQEHSHSSNDLSVHVLFASSSSSTEQVRPRYVSSNVELVYEVISDAFEERLNSKSKQNSRLLQTLPLFLRIPRVRVLASRHLERWLQSPALAGLARTLFAEIVKNVERNNPPLFDDLEVVDNILKLKLKANQLGIFVEHITTIVKALPSVAKQVFTHCIAQGDSPNDKLSVLRAVYITLDKKDAAETLASSIIALESEEIEVGSRREEIIIRYKDLYAHLCHVVDSLNTAFDGFHFAKSIIEAKMGTASKISSAQNSGRLIFLCATLVTRNISSLQYEKVDAEELSKFRIKMLTLRKAIMRWCMKDLCSVYHKKIIQEEERRSADSQFQRGAVVTGPGIADYNGSALDADSHRYTSGQPSSFNELMSIIRCLMFLSNPPSGDLEFLLGDCLDSDHINRIQFCCTYGVDIDDELVSSCLRSVQLPANAICSSPIPDFIFQVQLLLTSDSVTPITAISIIENLVERCNVTSTAKIVDFNSDTVLDMYELAEYKPVLRNQEAFDYESTDDYTSDEDVRFDTRGCILDFSSLPRLAVTSLWWRVSCIALVLIGLSPNDVGAALWNQHPTLRALIKMTTSQKYRFPTAECDEAERDKVKQMESRTRETEASIVEKLFLPQKPRQNKQAKTVLSPKREGIRVSARQREKQERFRRIEEERNAAALQAEHLKLKKVLRSMQKNVMLFDPYQHQRKPPKGSIDLLLSVNNHFGLAEKFRQVTTPDLLLQTIGEGRSAIERAYDWLIPIISSHEEIIHRLQPNASCYLLLRAYGTEGEKNKELLDLTKPLLVHVKRCLTGEHGERHAMLAMELLMSDIADERVTRRVCSRRVLQEAFGGDNDTFWLSQIIHDKHSAVFIPLVGRSVSRACAYERGEVLSTYVLGLSKYREFMQSNEFNFVSSLCELINIRPHVFAEALERFPELRRLCITEVKHAIDDAITSDKTDVPIDPTDVTILVKSQEYVLPQNLLGAFIVLMSNWQKGDTTKESEEDNIMALLKQLIVGEKDSVLATAMRNGKRAVSVEEWVLLATSNSDVIAKQAALSVPDIFLPRLLLCCGMSKTSFVTMLERLTKLGASVSDPAKLYNELISTSAVSEWGLQRGNRVAIKKRIHGRIASYLRIFRNAMRDHEKDELDAIAKCAFVTWLASEVSTSTVKKSDSTTRSFDEIIKNLNASASLCLDEESIADLEEEAVDLSIDERIELIDAVESTRHARYPTDGIIISEEFINSIVVVGQYNLLDELLEQLKSDAILSNIEVDVSGLVRALMNSCASSNFDPSLGRVILKFVPQLSQFSCDDNLWQTIFIDMVEKSIDEQYLLSLVSGCISLWSDEGISACQEWILTHHGSTNALSMKLLLRFLVVSSGQGRESNFICAQSKEYAESTMKIVLQYLEMTSDKSSDTRFSEERNNLPDWLILTLILAKSHHQCIVTMLMETIGSNSSCTPTIYCVLLRLYLMFPMSSQWNDTEVINHLIKAAKHHTKKSLRWRCPFDSKVFEMLRDLGTSPHTRLLQSATEFTKVHSLIVIRHLHVLHERLVADGLGGTDCSRTGRVGVRPPAKMAQIGDRLVKVSILRWGFSYNESVWSSVLDLMLSFPAELLFTCGIDTGLLLVLEDCLKLFYAHVMELGSEECISTIRTKFVHLIQSFRACNSVEFQKWSQTDIAGFGTVQTLLLSKVGTLASH